MAHRSLSLGLYRAIWRWARSGKGVPFTLRFEDVRSVAPGCLQPIGEAICAPSVPLHEADAVVELAQRAFRDNRHLEVLAECCACCPALRARSLGVLTVATPQGAELSKALDRGMEAVRLLHHDYARTLARLRKAASEHAEREGIAFPIGTCFVHRVHRYRAVVFGWDRQCERSPKGLAPTASFNPAQPFYYCLPDEDDCQRVFGGVRTMRYVAQDDVDAAPGARIAHRAILNFFDGYSAQAGRYVPNRRLAFEFPDDYPVPEVSIAEDANILARADVPSRPAQQSERFERE